jgi:tetratricopeptide (TPR) repeat protein
MPGQAERAGVELPEPPAGLQALIEQQGEARERAAEVIAQALGPLLETGLLELRAGPRAQADPAGRRFGLHPAVAETVRGLSAAGLAAAVDRAMAGYWQTRFEIARQGEMQGLGGAVTDAARRALPYLLRAEDWGRASGLLEHLTDRDESPETLAFALPLLRRIARAIEGMELELQVKGLLAKTLLAAGRYDEAERVLTDTVRQVVERGDYRQASATSSHLLDLFRQTGRLDEALRLAEQKVGYTKRAGLGPWTQLLDEGQRLQVLARMGRLREVLD